MSDVLEGGSRRSGPRRWSGLVAGIAALVAVGTYAAAHRDPPPAGPAADRSPTGGPVSAGPPSPSAAGACGATSVRPLMNPQPLAERTGVQVLVGGYGVRLVDIDGGTVRPVSGIPMDAGHTVSDMVSAAGVTYVRSAPCDGDAGEVYRLDGDRGHAVAAAPVGGLLAGAGRVWTVKYAAAAPATAPVVLRPVTGGRALALPWDAYPVADSSAGVVVAGRLGPGRQPAVLLLDPVTGRPVRTLGAGVPLAVDPVHLLLVQGGCGPEQATRSCSVARIDMRTGAVKGRHHLPNGRVPVSVGSVSRDGRLVVFQLARADNDPRFDVGHPLPPSDVVVLHLDTGHLEVVPGLVLPPKDGAGLVFAGDSRWLFIAVNDRDHMHLLAWRPGLGPPRSVARLPGPTAGTPSLLVV